MAESTNISWTDATFSPWWGCTAISPGCDNCYAKALDKRFGGNHWEDPNRIMSETYWKQPYKWNRKAIKEGRRIKVFCGSMCDVFDKNAPGGQRERLWQVIRETPNLDWLLLTKRAPNIKKYLPADWGNGYPNVWLGVTVEDREHGFPRADILRSIPARVKFLSCEPLLEDLGFGMNLSGIDWMIVGGESGPKCRKMKRGWVTTLRLHAGVQNVPFFFKQWGGTGKSKGGCLIDGKEIKEFPLIRK